MILPDVDKGITGPIKISMDYMYLYDRSDRATQANNPHLVVVAHKYGLVWAYQLPNKGIMGGAHWLPKRLISDWDSNGMKDAVIPLKTDQELAMLNIQSVIQEIRAKEIIPINSFVGESECNGRVENAIRRVQEKTRALRHQISSNIRHKLHNDSPIMAWLVRSAAELISKYAPGEDGRTPYEGLRHEKCAVALVPFSETILYLSMKLVRRNKGDAAKGEGVWLGTIERTEEAIIGTEIGCQRAADGMPTTH